MIAAAAMATAVTTCRMAAVEQSEIVRIVRDTRASQQNRARNPYLGHHQLRRLSPRKLRNRLA